MLAGDDEDGRDDDDGYVPMHIHIHMHLPDPFNYNYVHMYMYLYISMCHYLTFLYITLHYILLALQHQNIPH